MATDRPPCQRREGDVPPKSSTPEPSRRIGAPDSKTRAALVQAALDLMLEGGYAAVTSRRVAAKAGLKPQLVHYYFRTMDDLFLEVFRGVADHNLTRQARAFDSAQPLRALWKFSTEPAAGGAVAMEFMALANHRPAIRAVIASYAEQFRQQQAEALGEIFTRYGIDTDQVPPMALLVLMASVSNVLELERGLGMSTGHADVLGVVEEWLARYEPREDPT
jgi:AcrR family transcriptional regulator